MARIYLTVAEIYQMQHLLIETFGGLHGVRDRNAVEAAVFRPQIGYYHTLEEEAAALMESLANNHGFVDGNKRIAFVATATFLELNGLALEVETEEGFEFIDGSLERGELRFGRIVEWVKEHTGTID